jgi:Endonuclease-reverse transcriptase
LYFCWRFNLPEIDWSNGRAQGRAKELLEAAENRLMEQMVTFSTHVRGNTLDLVITDMPERVAEVTEEGRLGTSDHVIIQMNIVIRNSVQPESRGLPDWHRADWAAMRRDFERHMAGQAARNVRGTGLDSAERAGPRAGEQTRTGEKAPEPQ